MKLKMAVAFLVSGVLSLSARTWTSADGEKELEGELQSFDEGTGKVTIKVEGSEVVFDLDKLSDKDQSFVQKNGESEVNITELLKDATLHQVVEGKVQEVEFSAEPEYYLLYFSASW